MKSNLGILVNVLISAPQFDACYCATTCAFMAYQYLVVRLTAIGFKNSFFVGHVSSPKHTTIVTKAIFRDYKKLIAGAESI